VYVCGVIFLSRQLLYLSYKNIFHKLRGAYKLLARIHYNAVHAPASGPSGVTTPGGVLLPAEDKHPSLLLDYRTYTEGQIQALCTEITQLMENSVIKNTSRTESKVFFSKLCGDYYRYCSEVIHDKNVRVNWEKKVRKPYRHTHARAFADRCNGERRGGTPVTQPSLCRYAFPPFLVPSVSSTTATP
jgi:hypothetical protein